MKNICQLKHKQEIKNDFIYKYVDLEGIILILKNQTLKFSNPYDFNDPFEFHDNLVDRRLSEKHQIEILKKFNEGLTRKQLRSQKKRIRQEHKEPQNHIIESFDRKKMESKVCCFSEINDNILMWAHYAKKHQGVCVKFDTKKLKPSFKSDSCFCKIKYYRKIKTLKYSNSPENAIEHWISSKGKDWEYEKEIRIILGSSNSDLLPFDINSISEIIFGCKLMEDKKLGIERLIFQEQKYTWINTSEMNISDCEYKLLNIKRN